MKQLLREHIISRLGTDIENLDIVLKHFEPITTKRNELVLQEGSVCKYVYFIVNGCLQVYSHDKEGNETTRDIVTEGTWCSELSSFGTGNPANENIRAIEPTELLAIEKANFMKMIAIVPQFDKVYKQILETSYNNSVYRINTFMTLSALDRVKWLMEFRPKLMTRVSSKLIASYLGINKDVYSRLKAKI